jgi:hypothetical protein
MLSHTQLSLVDTPLYFTQQMRDAACNRRGEWVVSTYDWDTSHPTYGQWGSARSLQELEENNVLKQTKVRFSENEIPRILHIFSHGVRNNTKLGSIHANLEQVAETLWTTGSLEHVAMRFLAVPMLLRAFSAHKLTLVTYSRPWYTFFGYCKLAYQGECNHVAKLVEDGTVLKSYPTYWKPYYYIVLKTLLLRHEVTALGAESPSVVSLPASVIGRVRDVGAGVGSITPTASQPAGILPTIPEEGQLSQRQNQINIPGVEHLGTRVFGPLNPYISGVLSMPSLSAFAALLHLQNRREENYGEEDERFIAGAQMIGSIQAAAVGTASEDAFLSTEELQHQYPDEPVQSEVELPVRQPENLSVVERRAHQDAHIIHQDEFRRRGIDLSLHLGDDEENPIYYVNDDSDEYRDFVREIDFFVVDLLIRRNWRVAQNRIREIWRNPGITENQQVWYTVLYNELHEDLSEDDAVSVEYAWSDHTSTVSTHDVSTPSRYGSEYDNMPELVESESDDDEAYQASVPDLNDFDEDEDDAAILARWVSEIVPPMPARPCPVYDEESDAVTTAYAAALETARQNALSVGMPKHGGFTPDDADIIASEDNRIVEKDGVKMIVGQDYFGNNSAGSSGDPDTKQIVGVLTAPVPKVPNVYSKTSRNANAAKIKRMDEKQQPYNGTPADHLKISKLVFAACGTRKDRAIFSEARIQRWAHEFFHLEELKSKKWSMERLEASMNKVLSQAYPEFMHNGTLKCSVKLEQMQEGKPPRLIIMDGDDGQLMALIVVKCFEDLLFEWMEEKSTKHIGKRSGVNRLVKNLTKKKAKLVEGDGSSWDTTCSTSVRSRDEDPILRHIMEVLIPFGVVPQQWHEEHLTCNEKTKLKLFFQNKLDRLKMVVDAIRRSGHRGTSCLNWWVNFVNWVCSIFKEPERFLDCKVRWGIDETGKMRWWCGGFEGDDSLCALYPAMEESTDEASIYKVFLGWWKRRGFNMKIVLADGRATFCGYHIACREGEPTGFVCPELPRALVGAGVSCSSTIIEAAKSGNTSLVRDIAAAGALARASEFAGLLPTVSRKFHAYAISTKRSRDVVDREMSMRVSGEEGHNFSELEANIESQNLAVTPTQELANLSAVQCAATLRELDIFACQTWEFEQIGDYATHRASLPLTWRPPN